MGFDFRGFEKGGSPEAGCLARSLRLMVSRICLKSRDSALGSKGSHPFEELLKESLQQKEDSLQQRSGLFSSCLGSLCLKIQEHSASVAAELTTHAIRGSYTNFEGLRWYYGGDNPQNKES